MARVLEARAAASIVKSQFCHLVVTLDPSLQGERLSGNGPGSSQNSINGG